MGQLPLTVYEWPSSKGSLKLHDGLLVIALRTDAEMSRIQARIQVREALKQLLAILLSYPINKITIFSEPGQAVRLLQPKENIGISISHEHEMSMAAINMNGYCGIDMMSISSISNLDEINAIALDYLGSQTATNISNLPTHQRIKAFAKAWTEFEAYMKCKGEPIVEWSPTRDNLASNYSYKTLKLPQDYIGTIAYAKKA